MQPLLSARSGPLPLPLTATRGALFDRAHYMFLLRVIKRRRHEHSPFIFLQYFLDDGCS